MERVQREMFYKDLKEDINTIKFEIGKVNEKLAKLEREKKDKSLQEIHDSIKYHKFPKIENPSVWYNGEIPDAKLIRESDLIELRKAENVKLQKDLAFEKEENRKWNLNDTNLREKIKQLEKENSELKCKNSYPIQMHYDLEKLTNEKSQLQVELKHFKDLYGQLTNGTLTAYSKSVFEVLEKEVQEWKAKYECEYKENAKLALNLHKSDCENEKLKKENYGLNERIAEITKIKFNYQYEVRDLRIQNEKLTKEIEDMKEEDYCCADCDSMNSGKISDNQEILKLKSHNEALESRNRTLEYQLGKSKADFYTRNLCEIMNELKISFPVVDTTHKTDEEFLQIRIGNLKEAYQKLEKQASDYVEWNLKWQDENKKLKSENSKLKSENQKLKTEIENQKSKLQKWKTEYNNMHDNYAIWKSRAYRLREDIETKYPSIAIGFVENFDWD